MHDGNKECNAGRETTTGPGAATQLYDVFATQYDRSFEAPSLRAAYDHIAWELVRPLLPEAPSMIVDVGCGTGRWVTRCQALSHSVIGIEPSTVMQDILQRKFGKSAFQLIAASGEMAHLSDGSADVVLAMGSLQYSDVPERLLHSMVRWLRPGGLLCVHVDGLVALTVELMRLGRKDEAYTRLEEERGFFTYEGRQAPLHLFNAVRLSAALESAGLKDVETRGLLISPTIFGRDRCEVDIVADFGAFLEEERKLSRTSVMTDAGKHIIAWGRRKIAVL